MSEHTTEVAVYEFDGRRPKCLDGGEGPWAVVIAKHGDDFGANYLKLPLPEADIEAAVEEAATYTIGNLRAGDVHNIIRVTDPVRKAEIYDGMHTSQKEGWERNMRSGKWPSQLVWNPLTHDLDEVKD